MKPTTNRWTTQGKHALVFVMLLLISYSCAKYKEYDAVFPAEDNALAGYAKLAIHNPNPSDVTHQMLENALKAQLTSIHPGNVEPAKGIEQIKNEIQLFDYNPKLDLLPESQVATLHFTINVRETIKRERKVSQVSLRTCNYLSKRNQCRLAGTASLSNGHQGIQLVLTGSITIKDGEGKPIIADMPFNRTLSDSGKQVKSTGSMLHDGINQIAGEFAKRFIPHRETIKSKILRGGDAVAVKLIEHNALNLAVNRLDRIVSKSSEPEIEDVYNLGLAYEAMNEFRLALTFYQKAGDIDADEEAIQIALKRIRRIIPR